MEKNMNKMHSKAKTWDTLGHALPWNKNISRVETKYLLLRNSDSQEKGDARRTAHLLLLSAVVSF